MAGIAKYQRVLEQLEIMIQGGIYNDRRLPSEPELAETLGVSRSVIRQAYGELDRMGLIERRAGIGTILKAQPRPKGAGIVPINEQFSTLNTQLSTEVLTKERMLADKADSWAVPAFGLSPDAEEQTPLYRIRRLRRVDGDPKAEHVLYLLAAQFRDDLLETADFTRSVFAIYAEHGRFPARAEEEIFARLATEGEVALLKMEHWPPTSRWVYERHRVTYDGDDRVLEVMRSVDRRDFFRSYRYAIQGARLTDSIANRDSEAQGD